MLNKLSKEIHENNKRKGFYDDEKNIGEMLALVHSEVSEALECDRKHRYFDLSQFNSRLSIWEVIRLDNFEEVFKASVKDTFEDELADILIRVLDLAAFKKIDIEFHIMAKLKYNKLRPYKHGKKY